MELNLQNTYVALMVAAGLFVAWLIHFWLRRIEKQRAAYVEKLEKVTEVVETSTVRESTEAKTKMRALESVETRFRIMRRLLVPAFLVMWFFMVFFPYLERLPATLMSILVGAMTVVVGIAARPLVENVIAGVVISTSQPFRLGDTLLIHDNFGTVEDITLTHTVIKRWDWRRYVITNHRLLQSEFLNYSLVDNWQWAYAKIWVSHDTDLERLKAVGFEAVLNSEYAVLAEEPSFWVMDLDKDAVECWIAGWALSPSAGWLLTHDIRVAVVKAFQSEGFKGQLLYHRWTDTPPGEIPPNLATTAKRGAPSLG